MTARIPMPSAMPADLAESLSDDCRPAMVIEAEQAERARERRILLAHEETHVHRCMAGLCRDVRASGTVEIIDMVDEALNVGLDDAEALRKIARQYATESLTGQDHAALADAVRDWLDGAVRKIAESRLPAHLRED